MCLIIAKPEGQPIPPAKALKEAFHSNKDGAGFAYATDDAVIINKGFMDVKTLLSALGEVDGAKDKNMIIHFRIATEGKVVPGNTHPFPNTKEDKYLTALDVRTPIAIAHNGVLTQTCKLMGDTAEAKVRFAEVLRERELSDTQIFIKHCLASFGMLIAEPHFLKLFNYSMTSKFALLTPKKLSLTGDFLEDKGCHYSNRSYAPIVTVTTSVRECYRCELCGRLGYGLHAVGELLLCYGCSHLFPEMPTDWVGEPKRRHIDLLKKERKDRKRQKHTPLTQEELEAIHRQQLDDEDIMHGDGIPYNGHSVIPLFGRRGGMA